MRTRFLNTDYFASSSSSSIETLSFLNLPVPHLPPSRLSNLEEQHLLRFDPLPNLSLEIQRLPIDDALSKFISQVVPEILDFQDADFEDPPSPNGKRCALDQRRFCSQSDEIRFSEKEAAEALYGETKDEIQKDFGYEALEKDDNTAVENEPIQKFEVFQFEAPELDTFLENTCFSEEGMQILSEVPKLDNDLDLLRPRLQLHYSNKVQELVYSVEDVTLEYDMDQKVYALEEVGSAQEQDHFQYNTFPLLEVDEISLRNFAKPSMEHKLLSFLENIKSQWNQKDNLVIDGMELLGSRQYDILEILSSHCLSKQSFESELASLGTYLGIDSITMVEPLLTKEDFTDCFLPANLVVFQEFVFFDVDSSQLYEVFFQKQATREPQTCDWMFREDMNFKNFNELIVNCELTLIDDSFKSLPAPIISDHDKIRSIYATIEEILSELKPLALSASDGIYLDWHLLDEDKCNFKIFSSYQSMWEELESHSIDFDQESFDDGKLVIDFVLSDDALSGPKMEEYKELLNMLSESPSDSPLVGVGSSDSLDNKRQQPRNGEQLPEENAGKASFLIKSMSQFNDLDFFLNPGKATARDKSELLVKAPDTSASFPKEGEPPSILAPMKNQRLEELQNFVPIQLQDKYNIISSQAADKIESCCMPMPVPYPPHAVESEQAQGGLVPFPDIIIVVNTQTFDKEMIVSRRSTYQRILAMEKEGAQVVERDLDLPVDVMISSAICLVWYDCRNIGKKSSSMDEASSCLPLCIENIATNVLTLLSFNFSSCILVFEGEICFLSTVMECSDGFYAAAASLGIDLQLFCSYSSELTDEIFISSILYCTRLYRGIYPKMPESETLAESFLTKFPSINSLTAHAILSSVGMLVEFLEWSHEHRILAVQRYHVPDESMALFSALCRFGEREDSKSIMTDCSSSASSCPDSNKDQFNVDSERKRRKCFHRPQKIDIHVDDIWQSEPLNQFPDVVCGPSGMSKPYDCWMSTYPEILDELKEPSSSLKDLFGQKQGLDIAQMMDPSIVLKPYDSQNTKGPMILDEIKNQRSSLNDTFLCQNQVSETTTKNKLDWNNTSRSENLHEDFIGEVIDFTGNPLLDKNTYSRTSSMHFSPWVPEMEQESTRMSKAARRLSFGKNSLPTFPTDGEINSGSDLWTSVKDDRQSSQENNGYHNYDDHHDKMLVRHREQLLEEVLTHQSAGNSKEFPFKEEISHYGQTPFSKAIHSAHPQPGSPWTIEFLNRIREKSRLRQQSFPCDTSTPGFGNSGNVSKVTKTRTPSILEFFKYQGGSNPGKMREQRKQKQSIQLSSLSQNERTSNSLLPTWTPIDKRSRKTLSFEMDDNGSQTRLVWSDGSTHHLSKKFRNK